MRWLINYIRSCFCNYDWEMLQDHSRYLTSESEMPYKVTRYYRCKKCGYVQKVKFK